MRLVTLAAAAAVASLPGIAHPGAAPKKTRATAPASTATPAPAPAAPAAPAAPDAPDAPALAARPKNASGPSLGYELTLRAWGGAFEGFRTLDASGPVFAVEAALTPKVSSGNLRLGLPLRAEHVERPGNDLAETLLSAGLEPEARVSRTLSVGGEAGLTWVDRPGWPDVYQRQADGTLLPTDRYGYTSWRVGASAWLRAGGGQHLRARYRYAHYAYDGEPAFDPADPGHLTPRDNGRHDLELSWRLRREGWTATARLESYYRHDEVALARDAVTGATTPGGVNNPLQRLAGTEPSAEVEWEKLGGRVDLALFYGIALQSDRYEGYYSYQEQHPRLRATIALSPRLEGRAGLEGRFLLYGQDSTSATRLEWGDRRQDTRILTSGGLVYALGGGFALLAEASWLWRETNYPDYVPNGIAPDYDIDFDYSDLYGAIGIEWRATQEAGRRRR